MPFTDPNLVDNPTTALSAPAAWGDVIRDDLMAIFYKPAVEVARSTSQSIPDATLTAITFDWEYYDPHSMHDTGSNTDRLTVPTNWGGVWLVGASVHWQNNGVGRRRIEIWRNDTDVVAEQEMQQGNNGECSQNLSRLVGAAAGDYFNLKVYQDWGSTLNCETFGESSPALWALFERGDGAIAG